MEEAAEVRKAIVISPEDGRVYPMGRMRAIFKADRDETGHGYSVSEWWLEPRTRLPDQHQHEEDHVFYVIEGTLSVQINDDWFHAAKGTYVLIPGGALHAFENQEAVRSGFIAFNVPGGFEERMPDIASALSSADLKF